MSDPYEDPSDDEGGAGRWIVTWADMMSVLLTFFIVLQAFSTLNERKFFEAMSSIQRAFQMPLSIRSPVATFPRAPRLVEEMQQALDQEGDDGISLDDYGDRIVLTVDSELLFRLGHADLTPAGARIMDEVSRVLTKSSGPVRVEGHTCDLPLGASSAFRDNWDLSTGRALSVVHELTRRGVPPERLAAVGYGEFHPVAPNDSEENRRRNRRVEFVIEKGISGADALDTGG